MLYQITLHLARIKEYPEGSARHGYEITAPLDAEGMLGPVAWKAARAKCRVRRFWPDEFDRYGLLVHRPGGSGGATWVIDYDPERAIDDEAGYRLNRHRFVMGEYVSIQDEDEKLHTFQVVAVRQLKPVETVESA
ncbi:hypothetical protein [Microvirga roseola]|uniref:hypothetical protein n=1 Tax=Microvirga roseola TaxID=2883126 RepID=UPI001E37C07B|nr:hypothetical protein [Microvirga roseola]